MGIRNKYYVLKSPKGLWRLHITQGDKVIMVCCSPGYKDKKAVIKMAKNLKRWRDRLIIDP